jgi:hypothetical protein
VILKSTLTIALSIPGKSFSTSSRVQILYFSKSIDFFTNFYKIRKALTKYYIQSTDIPVLAWLREQPQPKPFFSNMTRKIGYETSLADLEMLVKNYDPKKSFLESSCETLFGVRHYNKKPNEIKSYYRPDFKMSEHVYVNVDGLYWHCVLKKEKWYHYNLRKEFENNSLKLLQFYENELYHNPEIVKSIVRKACGDVSHNLDINECTIRSVHQTEAAKFLKENHLSGVFKARHVGIYYSNLLVAIMSFRQTKNVCMIERYCTKKDTCVDGGFSKMINFIKQYCLKSNVTEVNWNVIEYDVRYETKVMDFYGVGTRLIKHGWQYLPVSDRNSNKSVICNPELTLNNSCEDWWYPDTVRSRFITSFDTGYIAVTYYRYPQNEEGKYLIFDTPFVKDAIFNYVLSMFYLKLWLQGEKEANSKHQYFNQKWGLLANAAIAESIKPSYDEIINMDKLNTLFKKDDIKKIIGGYGREKTNMR